MLKIKNIRGFTLIEMIIVIVLIGILAAVALPKFASLTGTAQTSKNTGYRGAFAEAVGMAHGIWLAGGNSGAADIIFSDASSSVDLHMDAQGWPQGANGASALSCSAVWGVIMQNTMASAGYTATTAGTVCTFTGAGTGNSFTYDSSTGIVQ